MFTKIFFFLKYNYEVFNELNLLGFTKCVKYSFYLFIYLFKWIIVQGYQYLMDIYTFKMVNTYIIYANINQESGVSHVVEPLMLNVRITLSNRTALDLCGIGF